MAAKVPFHDSLYRLAQVGAALGVQLVRITQRVAGNRYTARPVEFDAGGATIPCADADEIAVTNLAEPSDSGGTLEPGAEGVAIDVEGRWIVYIRAAGTQTFPARVDEPLGGASYSLVEQAADGENGFADRPGGMTVTARNLAELSLGPGAAVEAGTIVLAVAIADSQDPATRRYVFDHPAYAKYLD